MGAKLVLVHGMAQQGRDADDLKGEWVVALRKGLEAAGLELPISTRDISFPYYGDTLFARATGEIDVPPVRIRSGDLDREGTGSASNPAPPLDPAEQQFVDGVLDEVRQQARNAPIEIESARHEARRRGLVHSELGVSVFSQVDEVIPSAGAAFVRLFAQEVYRYLTVQGIRDEIEQGVRAAIGTEHPTVVVGHSLGSIVSYNVLKRDGDRGWRVPLFITLGSPLAVNLVYKQLSPATRPPCVAHWVNAFDPRDLVALRPLDGERFGGAIQNINNIMNDTPNRHGIGGYLGSPVVARTIYDALR